MTLPSFKLPDFKEQQLKWQAIVAKYQNPNLGRSIWQIVNTFGPYLLAWFLMYRVMAVSYWLTLLMAPVAAGLLVRIFIILHDCGHGSYFKSNTANDVMGTLAGILTFTPYLQWRHEHAIHHATSGDLDRRGVGDVYTMTVDEYRQSPWWKRAGYRLYRHPIVMFGFGPLYVFLVSHRFVSPHSGGREKLNLHLTNLAILALILIAGATIGFKEYLLIQLPIMWLSATAGVWMFYVQHQFEDTYWREHPEWQYVAAALEGSSYYKLPKVLQWFTGNIGFHHIHHLSPRIPNYNLEKAFKENPIFQHVTVVTMWESIKTLSLKLWDEQQQKMVSFRYLKSLRQPR
ncbi:MAG TPA: fatty acid desaturase [Anaerolineales bacterium]|nr:fatty acid desaturase [Anaerolineales bacterium]